MARRTKREQRLQDELANYVRRRYEEAKEHKSDDYLRLRECFEQVKGSDLQCDGLAENIKVKMNITSPIARGITGLMRDVFSNSIENPFVIKSTPVADVNSELMRLVRRCYEDSWHSLGYRHYRLQIKKRLILDHSYEKLHLPKYRTRRIVQLKR